MKKTAKLFSTLTAAIAAMALFMLAGCGGSSSSVTGRTIYGYVKTPGGTSTARTAGRSAAALINISTKVPVGIYSVAADGTQTLISSGTTDTSGTFSFNISPSVSYKFLLVKAAFGSTEIRSFVGADNYVTVSPLSETTVSLIEAEIERSGATYSSLTTSEIATIQTAVDDALSSESFSSTMTISEAVALSMTTAARNSTVTSVVTSSLSSETATHLAVFTTTDYTSGSLASLSLTGTMSPAPTSGTTGITTVHSDATLVTYSHYVFVINRYGADNIQVLDAANNMSLVKQYSTGNGSNPQDMVVTSLTKAYISLYGTDNVLIVNPLTGEQTGTISLAAFADSDGNPEMGDMLLVGTKLFVAVQRLVSWVPDGPGQLAVIDTSTDMLIDTDSSTSGTQGVTLAGQDPVAMTYDEGTGKILVSCAEVYSTTTYLKGIDSVNPSTYAAVQLIDKSTLGGSPSSIVTVSSTLGYVVISDSSYVNTVVPFNPTDGTVSTKVYTGGGYVPNIAIDPTYGWLLVADQSYTAPGIYIIDANTGSLIASAISTGLPPFGIAFVNY